MKNSLIIGSIFAGNGGNDNKNSIPTLTWYTDNEGTTLTLGVDLSTAKLVEIYRDGLLQQEDVDYTINKNVITFMEALSSSTKIAIKVYGKTGSISIEVVSDIDGNLIIERAGMEIVSDADGNVELNDVQVSSDINGNLILK